MRRYNSTQRTLRYRFWHRVDKSWCWLWSRLDLNGERWRILWTIDSWVFDKWATAMEEEPVGIDNPE